MTTLRTERLLARALFARFFESELMPPGLPQFHVVAWAIALFAAPGYLLSFVFGIKYGGVPPATLLRSTQADQLFFVTFGMMAVGMVALLTWESLFPDRRDVRLLGTLPLRARTHVVARLGAAGAVALLFVVGINGPPAVLYGLTLWGHEVVAGPFRAIAAHFIATAMGGLFMFFALMAVQGALLSTCGRRTAHKVALVLQAGFVVVLLHSLLFVPSLAGLVRAAFADGGPALVMLLPPVWFLALYDVLAGARRDLSIDYALTAIIATVVSVAGAGSLFARNHGRLVRMALETPDDRVGVRHWLLQPVVKRAGIVVANHPVQRAVADFTLRTVARSRPHLVLLATYVGIAAALVSPGVIRSVANGGAAAFDAPSVTLLSVPLAFSFFGLCGMRVLISIPTDIKANWVFRLHAREDRMVPAISGVRTALMLSIVAPIAISTGIVGVVLWGVWTGAPLALLTGLLGLSLLDVLLFSLRKIPFACTYYPGRSRARTAWPFYVIAFSIYTYSLAEIELVLLRRPLLLAAALIAMTVFVGGSSALRRRALQEGPGFRYEEGDLDGMFPGFKLSEGLSAESGGRATTTR